jgi:hypothetical protein
MPSASPFQPTPANAVPFDASAYLNAMVDVAEANSYFRQTIDWTTFRASVLQAGGASTTVPGTYAALKIALGLLGQAGDPHSTVTAPDGTRITNPLFPPTCKAPDIGSPNVPASVGYVHVPGFGGTAQADTTAFASGLQGSIRQADRAGATSWIVDLRGNTGGNAWAMIAGVEPLLGSGTYGAFVDPSGGLRAITCDGSATLLECVETGNPLAMALTNPYALSQPPPRVAVLTDAVTASAGELTLVCFLHRPNTRVFGTPTCGVPTGIQAFPLAAGGALNLDTSISADRSGQRYSGPIAPDEVISDPTQVVQRALAWLAGQ